MPAPWSPQPHVNPVGSAVWSRASFRDAASDRAGYFRCKRVMDVLGAATLSLFLLPLLGLIVLAIKLDSPGPVLFVQSRVRGRRVGSPGSMSWRAIEFPFYKFRTMYHHADAARHRAHVREFVAGRIDLTATDRAPFKIRNDARITRVGRVLRRTSLDELPQLLHILRGEMSLVGPRPVPTYEAETYALPHLERLAAIPGLTGLWQVRGRSRLSFEEMIRLDLEYVRTQSLWLDLKVLVLTVPVVLSGRGAN